MSERFLEIELRYKVKNVTKCLEQLKKLGVTVARKEHLIDEWYMPTSIQSLDEQRDWFDNQKGIAWRIRRIDQDGVMKLDVTSKQLTEASNHNSFHENTVTYSNYEEARATIEKDDYRNWLTIDKTRLILTSSNPDIKDSEFELVIDEIAGLAEKIGIGACLEIENKRSTSREEALQKIESIANSLGLHKEDQFEKSLTVVSMTELARF